ncbi:MAG: helix-turn-helix transcriptional regulator [Vagococcus sp.]|uniref:helix-turn-helix domain-containing protein n=1 Tax=Vagococcus sp. TaxID=1933889 RepID=UPI002FC7107C
MNTKQLVKNLANKRGITIAELERTLGIANGTIGKWDKQNPTTEPLSKLSDYFNVSIDYLLGKTENPFRISSAEEDFDNNSIDNHEKEEEIRIIQRAARNMNDEERKKAIDLWKIAFDNAFDDESN